ncbi:MAG: DUF1540 domain-containing protein [Thermoanaerobacteraceae bacterium]|nr:DUF1540 domain-containing protein [Thermoanaerobacteraceae bacterium]
MDKVNCEALSCVYNDDGECSLEEITITQRGLNTDCGDFYRQLAEDDTTLVFSFGKPDDTPDRY